MSVKILVLKPHLLLRLNGGDICLLEKLSWLRSKGLDTHVSLLLPEASRKIFEGLVQAEGFRGALDSGYEISGQRVSWSFQNRLDPNDLNQQSAYEGFFGSEIQRLKPDLVWSHYTDFFSSTAALKWNPSRVWIDITDNEYPRLSSLGVHPEVARAYSLIQHIQIASPFMKREVQKDFPNSQIHYLPNRLESLEERPFVYRGSAPWLFVNPTAVKGIDFIRDLAREMPGERFLIVGNWGSEAPKNLPSNAEYRVRQASLSKVWDEVKGLLMPSVWQEAFGRLPLEAMAHGVPVISSDRGALPETVGSGGIILPLEVSLWREALSKTEAFWRYQVESGFKRWKAYQAEVDAAYAKVFSDLAEFDS